MVDPDQDSLSFGLGDYDGSFRIRHLHGINDDGHHDQQQHVRTLAEDEPPKLLVEERINNEFKNGPPSTHLRKVKNVASRASRVLKVKQAHQVLLGQRVTQETLGPRVTRAIQVRVSQVISALPALQVLKVQSAQSAR